MLDTRLVIIGLWTATMLLYLLGDVIRIFAGDMTPGKLGDKPAGQGTWLLIAGIMAVPVLLLVLTLVLPLPYIRWVNVIGSVVVFVFNLFGLPYKGHYDNFLIVLSLMLNLLVFYLSFGWT